MGELECNNLDLQDHLQLLEQQLQHYKQQPTKLPALVEEREEEEGSTVLEVVGRECTETLHAKNQYIAQLERETEAVHLEIKKLASFSIT